MQYLAKITVNIFVPDDVAILNDDAFGLRPEIERAYNKIYDYVTVSAESVKPAEWKLVVLD